MRYRHVGWVSLVVVGLVSVSGCSKPKRAEQFKKEQDAAPIKELVIDHKTVATRMHVFFEETMRARDAVIRGDIKSAAMSLEKLATVEFDKSAMPPLWEPEFEQWRALARIGGRSQRLEEIATSVGQLGAQCGHCHKALGAGPHYDPSSWVEDAEDLQAHMFLLTWASDRMWEGLTEPRDQSWRVGAETLLEAPIKMEKLMQALGASKTSRVRNYPKELKRAGQNALVQQDAEARADGFAQILLTCASCHTTADASELR